MGCITDMTITIMPIVPFLVVNAWFIWICVVLTTVYLLSKAPIYIQEAICVDTKTAFIS